MTLRQACVSSSKDLPTHALVRFHVDDTFSTIPLKRIVEPSPSELKSGGTCQVKWTKGQTYTSTIIVVGTKDQTEDRLRHMESLESNTAQGTSNKKQAGRKRKRQQQKPRVATPKKKKKKTASEFQIRVIGSPAPATYVSTPLSLSPQKKQAPSLSPQKTPVPSLSPQKTPAPSLSPQKTQAPSLSPRKTPAQLLSPEKTPTPSLSRPQKVPTDETTKISTVHELFSTTSSEDSTESSDSEIIHVPSTEKIISIREIRSPIHMIPSQTCCCDQKLEELTANVAEIKETLLEVKSIVQLLSIPSTTTTNVPNSWQEDPMSTPPPLPPPLQQSSPVPVHKSNLHVPKSSTLLTPLNLSQNEFSTSFLVDTKVKSSSRANFAARLVRNLYTEEERKISNVRGVLGKRKLSPTRLDRMKEATIQMYPCDSGENLAQVWTNCCKAIDGTCCRLNRKPKENIPPTSEHYSSYNCTFNQVIIEFLF